MRIEVSFDHNYGLVIAIRLPREHPGWWKRRRIPGAKETRVFHGSIDQYSTCMLMLDPVPSRILAYVTCRIGRFFHRFCNSRPRVPDGPDLIRMRRAWPRRGFLSNAVMTYPVVARNSFLIVSSSGRESRASWFIDGIREIPHPDLLFSRVSAYKRSRKSSNHLKDTLLFSS